MSVYYWQRAVAAIERRRERLCRYRMPDFYRAIPRILEGAAIGEGRNDVHYFEIPPTVTLDGEPKVPDDPNDPIWREIERLLWLERFARISLQMAEEAEIF